jgi:crotonobetainyl-CoA:carnitine CoA-transferase CaiB-like acyl-CoA transferase
MLSSLKVIDISTVLAGPSVGMFFAELGASVTKIEHPNLPDVTRSWKGEQEDKNAAVSSYFASINYGKSYIQLNLSDLVQRDSFLALVKDADILISNFKSSDYAKFGITTAVLNEVNPRLIHGRISGYGSDSDRVAYDLILQAETGFMSMNGTPASGPVKMPVALIDVLSAHQLKEGILLALLERTQTNVGKVVHVSLYEAAICSLVNQASSYLMNHRLPQRIGSLHPSIAPYGEIFLTKDGKFITFAIGSDTQFQKVLHKIGLGELVEDARFLSNQLRVQHRSVLFELMEKHLLAFDAHEMLQWSQENFIPCGQIKNLEEVFQEQQAQDLVREEMIDGILTKRVSSIAFKYSDNIRKGK